MNKKSIIKRPLPAHNQYIRSRLEDMKSQIVLSEADLNELLLDEWRCLTEEEREPFLEQAKKQREEFEKN